MPVCVKCMCVFSGNFLFLCIVMFEQFKLYELRGGGGQMDGRADRQRERQTETKTHTATDRHRETERDRRTEMTCKLSEVLVLSLELG